MTTWVDHQTDPKKLASPRRIEVIAEAKVEAERLGLWGILVQRDITSADPYFPMRLVAGPHPSVPFGHIQEVDTSA